MQKSVRSFVLVAVFADQTGCNPHPQGHTVTAASSFMSYVHVVLNFFGA